ncbi:MAG: 3-oxoacyl-[acyl-carrier-protein] synthase III C-terminal domain-containing protein [Halobacteria archaeon]|nr:3-oxoacyl-[acyl-carrier-protein] synthase III C-terminal domain-containing protein [Halobacteria archaeon]
MSTIDSTGVHVGDAEGITEYTARAGEECIQNSRIDKSDVELLINTSIFREDNIVEPSMATLIQKEMELNLDPMNEGETYESPTFVLDLMNGANGFLNAAKVAEGMIKSGRVDNVLVVGGESHPSGEEKDDFPYSHSGAAALFVPSGGENRRGFGSYSFGMPGSELDEAMSGLDLSQHGGKGRDMIEVERPDNFEEKLRRRMVDKIEDYLDAESLETDDIDGLIVNQPEAGFARSVAEGAGIDPSAAVDTYGEYGDTNSASPFIGYHEGIERGVFGDGDRILFVTGTIGLSLACGHYVV